MFKATPQATRSLRKIAETKNNPSSFVEAPQYCAQCGVPLTGEVQHGAHYGDSAEQAKPSIPTGAMTPFTLGGS
jgi:hypothetical protein